MRDIDVVFVGDSITEFWLQQGEAHWLQGFTAGAGKLEALNLGVAGDRTEHVLHRIRPQEEGGLGNLDHPDLAPRFVVMLIGTNNTFVHGNKQIAAGVTAVAQALRAAEPQARVLVCSILPQGDVGRNQQVIEPINRAVAHELAPPNHGGNVSFVDLTPLFSLHGRRFERLFGDDVHLSAAGYAVFKRALVERFTTLETGTGAQNPP